jgi:hypothetical protein
VFPASGAKQVRSPAEQKAPFATISGVTGFAPFPAMFGTSRSIHVPGFRVRVPLGNDPVIRGLVIALEIVVLILTTIERVRAGIESIATFFQV